MSFKPVCLSVHHLYIAISRTTQLSASVAPAVPTSSVTSFDDQNLLAQPSTTSEFGRRALSCSASLVWNDLAVDHHFSNTSRVSTLKYRPGLA